MSSNNLKKDIQTYKAKSSISAASSKKSNPSALTKFIASKPKWIWMLSLGTIGIVTVAFSVSAIVMGLYNPSKTALPTFPLNSTIGQSCTSSTNCMLDSYCNIASGQSIGTCQCIPNYYYNQSSAKCAAKKGQGSTCNFNIECMDSKLLTCITSVVPNKCDCDTTTMFYNSTAVECQYKKAPIGLCLPSLGGADCPTFSSCSGSGYLSNWGFARCMCAWNGWSTTSVYYYNVDKGICEIKKFPGVACSTDWECTTYAYCERSTGLCACDQAFYYLNGRCIPKSESTSFTLWNIGCSYIDQCNWMQNNLRCISSLCRCDPFLEVWDGNTFYCVPKKRYGQTCSTTTDCIETTVFGLQCLNATVASGTRKACLCPSTQYFDVVSGMCLTKKVYNSQCNSRKECADSESMVCVALGGGVTKRCLCAPNYAYYNSTSNSCTLRKAYGATCASSTECSNLNGMGCFSTKCGCDPLLKYYDTTLGVCLPLKRTRDYCTAGTECSSGTCTSSLCT